MFCILETGPAHQFGGAIQMQTLIRTALWTQIWQRNEWKMRHGEEEQEVKIRLPTAGWFKLKNTSDSSQLQVGVNEIQEG